MNNMNNNLTLKQLREIIKENYDEENRLLNINEITFKIKLGNEAMQTNYDVAEALRKMADLIDQRGEIPSRIRDRNGNTVGSIEIDDQ